MILNLLNDDRFISEIKSIKPSTKPLDADYEGRNAISPQFKQTKLIDGVSRPKIKSRTRYSEANKEIRRKKDVKNSIKRITLLHTAPVTEKRKFNSI